MTEVTKNNETIVGYTLVLKKDINLAAGMTKEDIVRATNALSEFMNKMLDHRITLDTSQDTVHGWVFDTKDPYIAAELGFEPVIVKEDYSVVFGKYRKPNRTPLQVPGTDLRIIVEQRQQGLSTVA